MIEEGRLNEDYNRTKGAEAAEIKLCGTLKNKDHRGH